MSQQIAIYQMFPRNYSNETGNVFEAMTDDLERVKNLGFNTIYINPLSEVGSYPKIDKELVGSMYATSTVERVNPSFFSGSPEERELFTAENQIAPAGQAIKDFCSAANAQGITPMFDLVMGHLAYDSPYIKAALDQDPPVNLVARHANGNFEIHHLNDEYQILQDQETGKPYTGDLVWDDVVNINWNDPDAKEWATQHIFEPYVRQMAQLGFGGIRIDAPYNVPADVMEHMVNVFTEECRKEKGENYQPLIYPEILGIIDPKKAKSGLEDLENVSNHVISSGFYHPNQDDRRDIQFSNELISGDHLNDPEHWLNKEIQKRRNLIGDVVIPASSHDSMRLVDNVKTMLTEGGIDPNAEDFQDILQRSIRAKLAFSIMFGDGWMLTSGDEYLSNSPYAVLEGKLISHEQGENGQYVIGKKEDGSDIILPSGQYNSLIQHLENGGSETITIEGQSFTFAKGDYFDKPVWKYEKGEEQEKTPHLVLVTPQAKMSELAQQHQHDLEDPNSLLSFIKELNTHLQQRTSSAEIPRDARTFIEYSDTNKDIMYFIKTDNWSGTKPKHEGIIYDIHAININPNAQEITLDKDKLEQDLRQTFGLPNDKELPDIHLVGAFSAKRTVPTPVVNSPNSERMLTPTSPAIIPG